MNNIIYNLDLFKKFAKKLFPYFKLKFSFPIKTFKKISFD